MHLPWLEAAGSLTLSCYLLFMGGLLTATVIRAALGSRRPRSDRRLRTASSGSASREHALWGDGSAGPRPTVGIRAGRFLFDYVGNVDSQEHEDLDRAGAPDRRRDHEARELLNWIKEQMAERGFPARDEREFLEDLRQAIRKEGRVTSGERVTGVFEDSPPR